jgi:hypothetical protein
MENIVRTIIGIIFGVLILVTGPARSMPESSERAPCPYTCTAGIPGYEGCVKRIAAMNCDDSVEPVSRDEVVDWRSMRDKRMPPPMPGMDWRSMRDKRMPPPMPGMMESEEDMHGDGENLDETMNDRCDIDYSPRSEDEQGWRLAQKVGKLRAMEMISKYEEEDQLREECKGSSYHDDYMTQRRECRTFGCYEDSPGRDEWTAEQEEIFEYNTEYNECIASFIGQDVATIYAEHGGFTVFQWNNESDKTRIRERCKVKGVCHPNSLQGCFR